MRRPMRGAPGEPARQRAAGPRQLAQERAIGVEEALRMSKAASLAGEEEQRRGRRRRRGRGYAGLPGLTVQPPGW